MNEAPASRVNTKKLVSYYEALKRLRVPWEHLWQDIATYIVPRRYPGMGGTVASPGTDAESRLFDNTAVQAHQTNANGCLAWMTPQDSAWAAFTPPATIKDDTAKKWLASASQTTREALARSNFYLGVHEFYFDRSGPGTACLYAEAGEDEPFYFQHWPVGTFVIAEDHKGTVNTVVREFKLTAEQAEEKFGAENLPQTIQKCLKKGGDDLLREFCFLHFVMPRKKVDREAGDTPQKQMPYACYYIEKEKMHLCRENGYNRFPCFVSRYLEWGTATGGVYGSSPAFNALPEARQLNFLQKMMDAMAERMAFPPILAPEELEGEIDANAAAPTYFSKDLQAHQMPREWLLSGKYDIGKDRVIERQNAINKAFHVDLFQLFASLEKTGQMTAREVAERSAEKLVQFSPTFARLTTELLNPLMQWLFGELLAQNAFGRPEEIPTSLMIPAPGGTFVIPPTVQYSSRIALALRQLPVIGTWRSLDLFTAIASGSGNPAVFDNVDWDKETRSAWLINGCDADNLRPQNQVKDIRDARAEAQQQQEQMEAMAAMADATGKLGGIKQDSVIGKMAA